jgi:hypothetical protein
LRATRDAPSVFHEESIWLSEIKASFSSSVSSVSPAAIAPISRMEEWIKSLTVTGIQYPESAGAYRQEKFS